MLVFIYFVYRKLERVADSLPLALLPPMHSDQGDQLQQYLHLPSTARRHEGQWPGYAVCQLRLQRLCDW
jgi:hypothetical protein